jgi:uncharacterized membrane protein YgdD (TMEM256/DUF423 family)
MNPIRHGAIHAFLAIAAGAFGAHGLQNVLSEYSLKVWQTAATYQLAHALALLFVGLFEEQRRTRLTLPHWAFGLGIVLFSGSLYALALTGVKALGMITPLGGMGFLVGWFALAWQARRV